MKDIFCQYADGTCEHCGKACGKRKCVNVCPVLAKSPTTDLPYDGGPGAELRKLLIELGVEGFEGCGCGSKAAQMNRWGVEGCRENFDAIRGWIADAQAKAGWLATITAAANAATSGLAMQIDPLDIPGSLVRLAIERADR
jgi:hypothetical protein